MRRLVQAAVVIVLSAGCGPSPVQVARTRVRNGILKFDDRVIDIYAKGLEGYDGKIRAAQARLPYFNSQMASCSDVPCLEALEKEIATVNETLR